MYTWTQFGFIAWSPRRHWFNQPNAITSHISTCLWIFNVTSTMHWRRIQSFMQLILLESRTPIYNIDCSVSHEIRAQFAVFCFVVIILYNSWSISVNDLPIFARYMLCQWSVWKTDSIQTTYKETRIMCIIQGMYCTWSNVICINPL